MAIFSSKQAYLIFLFSRHSPKVLFSANAYSFARGTIGSQGGSLEYHEGDHDLDISKVPIRDWLLAKAFLSRTGPMGSGANKKWDEMLSFDMSDPNVDKSLMTDPSKWRHKMPADTTQNEWRHSDWKNMPYVHVYKLFEKIAGKDD